MRFIQSSVLWQRRSFAFASQSFRRPVLHLTPIGLKVGIQTLVFLISLPFKFSRRNRIRAANLLSIE